MKQKGACYKFLPHMTLLSNILAGFWSAGVWEDGPEGKRLQNNHICFLADIPA
jgi:hypothetical protein